MAISFVNSTTASINSGTDGNPSVPVPSGVQNGDVLIAMLSFGGTEDATPASGWTELADISGSGHGRTWVVWRTMSTGVTAASWAMDPVGSTWGKMRMAMIALRGAGTPTAGSTVSRSGSSTSTVAPSVTTDSNNDWIVGCYADRVSNQTSVTSPSGMTERAKLFFTDNGGCSVYLGTEQIASAGATGTRTATYGVGSANGMGVLLKIPATAGTPPVVNAGPDQEVAAGSNVVLSGATSTGSTHSWTVLSGPASPSISNSTNLTTANLTPTIAGHYVIRLSSTNGDGTTTDDKNLYVTSSTAVPDGTVSGGSYTIQGGSASVHEALADASDGTYVESPDPGAGASFTVTLTPLEDGTVTVTVRAKSSTTPVYDMTVVLRQGSTSIASETFTTSTSWSDYSFTTSPGQTANITNFNDLRVFVAAV